LIDLKAELIKKQSEFEKEKLTGVKEPSKVEPFLINHIKKQNKKLINKYNRKNFLS